MKKILTMWLTHKMLNLEVTGRGVSGMVALPLTLLFCVVLVSVVGSFNPAPPRPERDEKIHFVYMPNSPKHPQNIDLTREEYKKKYGIYPEDWRVPTPIPGK